MSAIDEAASGVTRWSAVLLAFRPPRGLAAGLTAFGPAATARLRARQFLAALRGTDRKRPAGNGGPGEPPEADPTPFSHWNDPVLWTLMMH